MGCCGAPSGRTLPDDVAKKARVLPSPIGSVAAGADAARCSRSPDARAAPEVKNNAFRNWRGDRPPSATASPGCLYPFYIAAPRSFILSLAWTRVRTVSSGWAP